MCIRDRLLTLPTGFGKTYYVLQYIAYHLQHGFDQRIWFITNLKKNLPHKELKEIIGEDLYHQQVVFLNSYAEQIKDFFAEGNDVDENMKNHLKSYEGLIKAVNDLKHAPNHSTFRQYLQEELMKKERAFSCLLYTSPSPRDATLSRMPSSA